MPARISRAPVSVARPAGTAASKKHKTVAKRKRRTLDAYSIASKQEPERFKLQQHRLGESEGEAPRRKRQRLVDEDEDEELGDGINERSSATRLQRRNETEGQLEELDVEEGSDSEGNEWKMGGLGSEDEDSEVDSDEAFGESDEEKFDGFTFRGSASGRKEGVRSKDKSFSSGSGMMDLDEDEEGLSREEDDFGDEGVDLADILDNASGDDSDTSFKNDSHNLDMDSRDRPDSKAQKEPIPTQAEEESENEFHSFESESDAPSEEGDIVGDGIWDSQDQQDEEESASDISDTESDENDPDKIQHLKDMVSSLSRSGEQVETSNENDSRSQAQRMMQALQKMPGLDPALSRSAKKLAQTVAPLTSSKTSDVVQVPLPKRQQNQLDRIAAYKTAKDTLGRWIDTVKYNRRADHLSFPLKDPEAQEAQGTSRFLPTVYDEPQTELESTIQNILHESGLGIKGDKSDEEKIREFEELQTNKMPMEEVLARRAELRKARELLFREEIRAKRIKKIKSKAYRRVHRKERERDFQKQRSLLAAEGVDLSEEEKEANDRRRAEERMGARHRESRWAKGVKQTGRAIWDDDARSGVIEMARRNEQLRKRLEGKAEGSDDSEPSGGSDEESEDGYLNLEQRLRNVEGDDASGEPLSRLQSMKFMQRADATQKRLNEEAIQDIRSELAGEDGEEIESEAEGIPGRRSFGPTQSTDVKQKPTFKVQNELEERLEPESEAEDHFSDEVILDGAATREATTNKQRSSAPKSRDLGKPQFAVSGKARKFEDRPRNTEAESDESHSSGFIEAKASSTTNGWTTVQYSHDPDDEEADSGDDVQSEMPMIPSNAELIKAAFGGDDVEADFEREKKALVGDEEDKVIDHALPGWGSWVGEGIGKRELNRNKGKFLTKEEGVKPSNRKDSKLERAIISEKRVKKNAKYLASTLPHPFENRQQYERALRIPIGPEWTTKETFQKATKPRVMVKQGIIKAMERPLL